MNQRKKPEVEKVIDTGYILGDGTVLSTDEFIKQVEKFNAESKTEKSQQISKDQFDYEKDDVVKPPIDFNKTIQLLDVNTEHARCVRAKAMDIIGKGWSIIRDERIEKAQCKETDRQALDNFFSDCNDDYPFEELLKRTLIDFNSIGNANIEVARSVKGYPARLYHADTPNIRVKKGGTGFLQIIDLNKVHFQNFGEKVRFENGKISTRNFINPATGKKTSAIQNSANELINIINYYPGQRYYGVPDFIPALRAINGNVKVADYNMQYFDHNAIPSFAVLIHGGKLSKDLRQLIEYYFRYEIKGKAHKTLILPVPYKDVKVEFKPLNTESNDGSFGEYRKDNRDEVLLAHGVFPGRIGIVESAHLGSGTGESQNKNYQRGIIDPMQLINENKINKLITIGFDIRGWKFKFKDIDVNDEKNQSEIAEKTIQRGIETPNETRIRMGKVPYEKGGDRAFIVVGNEVIFIDELDDHVSNDNKNIEKVLHDYQEFTTDLEYLIESVRKNTK